MKQCIAIYWVVICIVSSDSRQYIANTAFTLQVIYWEWASAYIWWANKALHGASVESGSVFFFFFSRSTHHPHPFKWMKGLRFFSHSAVDFLNAPLKLKMKQRKEDRDNERDKNRISWSNKAKARETCLEASCCYLSVTLRDSPVQRAPNIPFCCKQFHSPSSSWLASPKI